MVQFSHTKSCQKKFYFTKLFDLIQKTDPSKYWNHTFPCTLVCQPCHPNLDDNFIIQEVLHWFTKKKEKIEALAANLDMDKAFDRIFFPSSQK